jgi:hypothetical protein
MKKRSDQDFESRCWRLAKRHFHALDKDHVVRMIERAVELTDEQNEEMDS